MTLSENNRSGASLALASIGKLHCKHILLDGKDFANSARWSCPQIAVQNGTGTALGGIKDAIFGDSFVSSHPHDHSALALTAPCNDWELKSRSLPASVFAPHDPERQPVVHSRRRGDSVTSVELARKAAAEVDYQHA